MREQEKREIIRLKEMLEYAGIPYHMSYGYIDRIIYRAGNGKVICSAIQGYGTYGYEGNLIEIKGPLTQRGGDNVEGWLTAEEVFSRIEKHWRESGERK